MTWLERLRLALASPVRLYLRHAPIRRGQRFLYYSVLRRLLPPPPSAFDAVLANGSVLRLQYRETIGLSVYVRGAFEHTESATMVALAMPGTTVIDVGANIGLHAIPIARSSSLLHVLALEPLEENVQRLTENAARNMVTNMEVVPLAIGEVEGEATLYVADDPGYATTATIRDGRRALGSIRVQQTTLDRLWRKAARPQVSLVKIDIEGGELAALRGGRELLTQGCPSLLVEADGSNLTAVEIFLGELGYRRRPVEGFEPWNHLFQRVDASDSDGPRYRAIPKQTGSEASWPRA